ncbi:unnamed protein product, partial [Wuchereria bancrofti]
MYSVNRIVSMVKKFNTDRCRLRYSSAIGDSDSPCSPNIRHFNLGKGARMLIVSYVDDGICLQVGSLKPDRSLLKSQTKVTNLREGQLSFQTLADRARLALQSCSFMRRILLTNDLEISLPSSKLATSDVKDRNSSSSVHATIHLKKLLRRLKEYAQFHKTLRREKGGS